MKVISVLAKIVAGICALSVALLTALIAIVVSMAHKIR